MFFFKNKSKKRKPVLLTKSTLVALDVSKEILEYIFQGKKFQVIHANIESTESEIVTIHTNRGLCRICPSTHKYESTILIQYGLISYEYQFKFLLEKTTISYQLPKESEISVLWHNKSNVFKILVQDSRAFTPLDSQDKMILDDHQKTLSEIYKGTPKPWSSL